jgi:anti-sigma factor RsiW
MSGCRDRGDDIGAYVLGALEPEEMEAMRRHLDTCARCAAEEHALAGLPGLLDRVQADEEPAPLSPRLEDEVLDRFVRERAEETTRSAGRRRFALPAVAAAAVALVLGLAVFLWPADEDGAYAHTEMRGHGAWAAASVAEVDSGARVRIEANDLPRGAYELWCVRTDGRWISGGSFWAARDGSADAELTAAVSPGEYHTVVITERSSMGARGAEIMRGELEY